MYAFYRYVKSRTWPRLLVTGLLAGCTLAAKHSAILLFPILLVLAVAQVLRGPVQNRVISTHPAAPMSRASLAARYLGALIVIGLISVGVPRAFYGFRYPARPAGLPLNPLTGYVKGLHYPFEIWIISFFARFHLLPESYLYGLTGVRLVADFMSTGLLGKVYPHGK